MTQSADLLDATTKKAAELQDNELDLTDAKAVKRKLAGSHPLVEEPEDPILELPRGVYDSGVWHTRVELRELTGADEEILSRYKTEAEFFNALLALGVVRIGKLDLSNEPVSAKETILDSLLIGEKSMIYMGIVRITFGNEKDLSLTCAQCGTEQVSTLIMDHDFPLEIPDDEVKETYEFTTSKGKVITYRLVIGADIRALESKKNLSSAEQNTLVLSSVINAIDGEIPFDSKNFVRSMSIKDRMKLLEEVNSHQPTINLTLSIDCIGCGEAQHVPLQWGDLFRP